ncbi:4Fe-4S dicluster domain-containing protein, partial [Chloroflexota bacterium]
MSPNTTIFAVIFIVAIILFGGSVYSRFRFVGLGKSEDRFNQFGRRIWNMLLYAFIQRRVVTTRYRFGLNHFIFFWCFMALALANAEFLLHGLFPDNIGLSKLPPGLYYALALIFDLVSLIALIAVIVAVTRRVAFAPSYIDAMSRDAFFILSMVAILMIAFFGLHGSEIALGNEDAAAYMPVSSFTASAFLSGASPEILTIYTGISWWVHAIVLLGFLNYLPYSKHMHVLTAIPNCFFRSLEKVTTQPREEFKKGNTYGVGQLDQFRWKDLFDSYSCTECGRCHDVCPATFTNKPLDPKMIIHDIKVNLLQNGPLLTKNKKINLPLIGNGQEGSVSEDSIWSCTTCGACMEVCPVFIEHVPKLVGMRRNLVEMKAQFPPELLTLFENMEQRSNPWGIAPGDRDKWTSEIEVKPFEAGKTEYLFYIGCAGAFDSRSKQV